jgi:tripartite-type tricarboxylate transporter receptor subunit TctC
MAGELLKVMAKIDIVHVPYKGNAPAMTDAVGGHVEMVLAGITSMVPLLEAGKLRAIGIGSKKRFSAVPNIPTFDESGLPGYDTSTWFGLMAPAATPPEIVQKINADVAKILASQDVRDRLLADGQEPGGGSTADFGKFIRDEIAKYSKVIEAAKIKQQ